MQALDPGCEGQEPAVERRSPTPDRCDSARSVVVIQRSMDPLSNPESGGVAEGAEGRSKHEVDCAGLGA